MLDNGERRSFLHDGDQVTLKAACAKPGAARIGWGACGGLVGPAT
jgi:fumarylacetoacetase